MRDVTNSNPQKHKILYLESLRGIAAILVIMFHYQSNIGSVLTDNGFIKNSWLMVDFFFVLSGFVISLNYQDKLNSLSKIINFQIRRFLRLYPLHILTLFLFLAIEIAKYTVELKLGIVANNPAFSDNNLTSFIHNIFLTQNLFLDKLTWNYPSWSISAEFYTYILYAIITAILFNKKNLFILVAGIISVSSFIFIAKNGMTTENGMYRCMYAFFLGVLLLNLGRGLSIKIPTALSYLLCGIIILLLIVMPSENPKLNISIYIPILFCIFIGSLYLSVGNNMLINILNNKYLIYLGTISYGTYMIHAGVLWAVKQSLRFVFNIKTISANESDVSLVFNNEYISVFILISAVILILVLAHFSYKLVEMPCNDLRHKLNLS
jgi:peptidoglycan/LPS O-acetylase OafA/YrhL